MSGGGSFGAVEVGILETINTNFDMISGVSVGALNACFLSHFNKNEFDIFLLAKCKFMIGTTSGPLIVPHTFNVPVVATNAPDLARFVYLPNSLVVPKKIIDKNERLLSFEEMFSHGYGHLDGYIPKDRLKMHSWLDNSSTEILDAVIEMNNRFNFITTEEQFNISKKISSFGFDGNVKISNKFIEKNLNLFKNFGI
jgi:putative glycosyltransferase (TIGR04372 family)